MASGRDSPVQAGRSLNERSRLRKLGFVPQPSLPTAIVVVTVLSPISRIGVCGKPCRCLLSAPTAPYTGCLDLPTRTCLDYPTQKCLTLLTDRAPDFWYNDVAQIASSSIAALVVARVRERGPYRRFAPTSIREAIPGGWSAVLLFGMVEMPVCRRPDRAAIQNCQSLLPSSNKLCYTIVQLIFICYTKCRGGRYL
jgi:hypothetical protein